MSDVNHQVSKTLVQTYGKQTLFVLEDLTGVTFDTVHSRKKRIVMSIILGRFMILNKN